MAARGILNNPAMYAGYNCTPLQCVTDWVSLRGRMEVFKYSYIHMSKEGGVRVCGDAVLGYFWCGFAVIFILTRDIAVSKH